MKSIILRIINRTVLKPIRVEYCSQTIYEVLIGCLRLFDATNDVKWQNRSSKLVNILLEIQQEDGGFDIGYEFNFGKLHKKGESTSPELIALIALVKFYKTFGRDEVAKAAHLAANWIRSKSKKVNESEWYIPYAPMTTDEVMVYNGTSFAAGALGVYLSEFPNSELENIYRGMIKYLSKVMASEPGIPGKFWYYSDQKRDDLNQISRNKIDYYHQMQQIETHCEAELVNPIWCQNEIILAGSEHVGFRQDAEGRIPYLNIKPDIHLWGYCSCASGFLMASKFHKVKKTQFREKAKLIYNWIERNAWNGEYFYPIISIKNLVLDDRFYVRSDAWVFNSFALAVKEGINGDNYLKICEKNYRKMEAVNFSGLENHASNKRKRFFMKILEQTSRIIKR